MTIGIGKVAGVAAPERVLRWFENSGARNVGDAKRDQAEPLLHGLMLTGYPANTSFTLPASWSSVNGLGRK